MTHLPHLHDHRVVLGGVGKRHWTTVSTLCSMPAITCCTDCVIMACSICIPANEGFGAGPLDEDVGCGAGGQKVMYRF